MQAAVHPLPPQMLTQYHRRQSLNTALPTMDAHTVMPTPPIAARKRKRAHQFTVNYSEVQEVDGDGRLREVIVIEDTPPPPTVSPATTHNGAFSASYQPPMYSAPHQNKSQSCRRGSGALIKWFYLCCASTQEAEKRSHRGGPCASVQEVGLVGRSCSGTCSLSKAMGCENQSCYWGGKAYVCAILPAVSFIRKTSSRLPKNLLLVMIRKVITL
jgi:hypothetical protein